MAKVYGQDIPSKHYDAYHNFFARSYDQSHQPYGKSVKKSNWDFPGYPYHPHFPSPAQLYVRAVFKSATECWHLQPEGWGLEMPDTGPRPRNWWETEADKDRTFGYRKFMRDTLIHKFRIGEPTWCVPIEHPFTYVDSEAPLTNYCQEKFMYCTYEFFDKWQWVIIQRNPADYGRQFLYVYCESAWHPSEFESWIDACLPHWFIFEECELTWADLDQGDWPFFAVHMSRNLVLYEGWKKFWVGDATNIALVVYHRFPHYRWPGSDAGAIFHSPRSLDLTKRPYFGVD